MFELIKKVLFGASGAATHLTGAAALVAFAMYLMQAENSRVCVSYPEIGLFLLFTYGLSYTNRKYHNGG